MKNLIGLILGIGLGISVQAKTLDCFDLSTQSLFLSIEHQIQGEALVTQNGMRPENYYVSEEVKTEYGWMGPVLITRRTYSQIRWMVTDEIHVVERCGAHMTEACQIHGRHVDAGNNGKTTFLTCKPREDEMANLTLFTAIK